MPDIIIKSVADIKRALCQRGVLVILDRCDHDAYYIARDDAYAEAKSQPRTVRQVRSRDVILESARGPVYMDLPKAGEAVFYDNNCFSIAGKDAEGAYTDDLRTYRVEMPGTPGALIPSKLRVNHPPISDEVRANEARADEAATADKALAEEFIAAERLRLQDAPKAPCDPMIEQLDMAIKAAVSKYLDDGIFYQDTMEVLVSKSVASIDFARVTRLPDRILSERAISGGPWHSLRGLEIQQAQIDLGFYPRGTLMRVVSPTGERYFTTELLSDGRGGLAQELRYLGENLTDQQLYASILGSEIYRCRQSLQTERELAANQEAIRQHQPYIGQEFRDIEIKGNHFSKLRVELVDEQKGIVGLICGKRGTSKVWKATVNGAFFADRFYPKKPEALLKIQRTTFIHTS